MRSMRSRSLVAAGCLGVFLASVLPLFLPALLPAARGQQYPGPCYENEDPCPTCPDGTARAGESHCSTVLGGWKWGDCGGLVGSCYQMQSSCGQELTCTYPPMYTGGNGCNLGTYTICD